MIARARFFRTTTTTTFFSFFQDMTGDLSTGKEFIGRGGADRVGTC